MKKLRKLLDFLWENDILKALAYLITLGWFAYAVNAVRVYDGGSVGKILFCAWAVVMGFIWLIHKSNNKE